uniref:EndoU domain-containing protein n=1 Tax=Timema monikensis TaxID=170555 RepID=A0A7R9EAV4_9NEOP|nr:unnamed protein product [Timema monikensis]
MTSGVIKLDPVMLVPVNSSYSFNSLGIRVRNQPHSKRVSHRPCHPAQPVRRASLHYRPTRLWVILHSCSTSELSRTRPVLRVILHSCSTSELSRTRLVLRVILHSCSTSELSRTRPVLRVILHSCSTSELSRTRPVLRVIPHSCSTSELSRTRPVLRCMFACIEPMASSTAEQCVSEPHSVFTSNDNIEDHGALGAIPSLSQVNDQDLQTFSETLLTKDVNNAAQYITINYQSKTRSRDNIDKAPQPLLTINRKALQIPTVAKVQKLYDNYIADVSVNEQVTSPEIQEENDLLDAFLKTSVMKYTNQFLIQKKNSQKQSGTSVLCAKNCLSSEVLRCPAETKRDTKEAGYKTMAEVLVGFSSVGCLPMTLLSHLDEGEGIEATLCPVTPNTIYMTPRLKSPGLVYCKSSALDHVTTESGLVASGQKAFRNLLHELWFTLYSRGNRKVGSSAFEHVFLGELKRGEVSGMHNWIYFSHEESLKHANYMGWIKKLDFGTKGSILKLQHKWEGVIKPVGSMFVGTSPELEMALYTVCFLTRPNERCRLRMANKVFHIKTFTFNYRGKSLIGSAFPEI